MSDTWCVTAQVEAFGGVNQLRLAQIRECPFALEDGKPPQHWQEAIIAAALPWNWRKDEDMTITILSCERAIPLDAMGMLG